MTVARTPESSQTADPVTQPGRAPAGGAAAPYDALLLVSFGGPEGPEDVLPFLENVTRGRGVPRDRLAEVAEHYHRIGGRSPINDQNRALLATIQQDLAAHGVPLPVYWGNRNWDPYLFDALGRMATDGVQRAAVFVTSAYASYSGCRQYREDLAVAAAEVGAGVPVLDKLRHYFNHPGFVAANADALHAAVASLDAADRDGARVVFVTHSIPEAMADASGPSGGAYPAQHLVTAGAVAAEVGDRIGARLPWDLVYCSRSGAPRTPWLGPDVNDHLEKLAADGVRTVVLAPVGFVSDHMEVVFDLDTEAVGTGRRLGLTVTRAATAGTHPEFVGMVRQLLLERAAVERGGSPDRPTVGGSAPSHDRCPAGCCPNPRGPQPALCGAR